MHLKLFDYIFNMTQEIGKYLQKVLNFSIALKTPDDKQWGTLSSDNKTWNGMISELLDDKIDICTSGQSITFDRAAAIDFSIPLLYGAKTLLGLRLDGSQVNWFVYLEIFTPLTWALCLLSLLLLSMVLLLANNMLDLTRYHSHEDNSECTILASLAVAFSMLLNLDVQVKLEGLPSMVATFCGSMFGYLVFSFYGSMLTAEMTAMPPILPIR